MLAKKWMIGIAAAVAISTSGAMSTAANAAVQGSPATATHHTFSPLTPSSCQGSPQAVNNATSGGVKYIELHTWTECFGTVSEITSYLARTAEVGPSVPWDLEH